MHSWIINKYKSPPPHTAFLSLGYGKYSCANTYTNTHPHAHTQIYKHTHTCTHTHTHTHTQTHTHTHTHTHKHTHTQVMSPLFNTPSRPVEMSESLQKHRQSRAVFTRLDLQPAGPISHPNCLDSVWYSVSPMPAWTMLSPGLFAQADRRRGTKGRSEKEKREATLWEEWEKRRERDRLTNKNSILPILLARTWKTDRDTRLIKEENMVSGSKGWQKWIKCSMQKKKLGFETTSR